MVTCNPSHILLIDVNASWMRSLMMALPGVREGATRLHAWQVYGSRYWLANRSRISAAKSDQTGLVEDVVAVPGWTRLSRLSTAVLSWKVKRFLRRFGPPAVIIYTLPQYAGVAAKFANCFQVYYAHDAYRFYDAWDPVRIGELENQILNSCDLIFAVSRQLQADFQKLTAKPVLYSPNAVSATLVSQLALPSIEKPPELRSLPDKVVGCVGQISESAYDWPLIGGLASALPEFTFVFIGPLADHSPESLARVKRVLRLPNVRWLGPRPHAELGRYFAAFDICFGPYAVTPLKQRGSPLRMYDYLCTSKPILFTPISEICHHHEYVEVGGTVEECVGLIRKMASSDYPMDLAARRRFLLENTWEKRAEQFWSRVGECRRAFAPDKIALVS
jgi:glycosyltransferase involved in cell wall biosynthesis